MGLDTTHDCWHGAYSAFARWREKIAEVAGFQLSEGERPEYWSAEMETLYGNNPRVLQGEWKEPPRDPLLVLLVHSDCDGLIKAEHCAPLADALEALLPKLDGDGGGHIGLYREKTEQFIAGLREPADLGEDVEFH